MFWLLTALALSGLPVESDPRLLSLRVVPEEVVLQGAEAEQQFVVLGQYSDALERDLTRLSVWTLSSPDLVAISPSGRLVALAEGELIVEAGVEGRRAGSRVRISAIEQRLPFRFGRDIGTILTRQGCNDSTCHGSVKGRGGFKLSANSLYPQNDYQWIMKGGTYQVLKAEAKPPEIPRVDLKKPAQSLLLLKPTMQLDHGGGLRFERESRDYLAILDWISQGAPFQEEGGSNVEVERLEVFPELTALEPAGSQQLIVTAYRSDGSRQDYTHRVHYESSNPRILPVSSEGLVTAMAKGETTVIIRAPRQVTSARLAVIGKPIPDYPTFAGRNFIDDLVFAKLRRLHIRPSERSTDEEFLRRICLDLTGTLPPPRRVREFLASRDPRKRDRLIETLLESPEYVDFWTFRFSDLFRVNYNARQDLKSTHLYQEWIRESIAANKPYDQMARERVAAQGNAPATQNYYNLGFRTPEQIAPEQARVFLGIRLDCAQCHDHPYEPWSQDHFWEMTAFFSRLNLVANTNLGSALVIDDPGLGERRGGTVHLRTGEEVKPRFLDGTALAESELSDPRLALAEWMTSPRNPFFAKAIVNRMWSYFLGRGIVDPVDDFRTTAPPTHPQLLEELARDFQSHGYDLKHLMSQIVQSDTYQLSGKANATNRADAVNYSRARPRALDAEVQLDAISQVTGVEEQFSGIGHPLAPRGVRAQALVGTRAIELVPELFASRFLDMHGRHSRATIQNRQNKAQLEQALHMVAGPTYTEKLSQPGGRISRLLESGDSDGKIIKEFYLAALARYPTDRERTALKEMISSAPVRLKAVEDFVWALVSSREFVYNH